MIERTFEAALDQQAVERPRHLRRIVLEDAAAPRTQHQPTVAVGRGGLQDTLGTDGQGSWQFGRARRGRTPDDSGVGGRGGQEPDRVRLLEQTSTVVAEDGHGG
jgi:hypothetical protein